jgi:hypothetical protein
MSLLESCLEIFYQMWCPTQVSSISWQLEQCTRIWMLSKFALFSYHWHCQCGYHLPLCLTKLNPTLDINTGALLVPSYCSFQWIPFLTEITSLPLGVGYHVVNMPKLIIMQWVGNGTYGFCI